MEVDDDPMEVAAVQQPSADPSTEVMLDAVDDYMGADFSSLGDISQPRYTISSHDSIQPVIQDPTIGVDSYSSFGGEARPGGRLDALGLAGMEMVAQPAASLPRAAGSLDISPRLDPTPPPM